MYKEAKLIYLILMLKIHYIQKLYISITIDTTSKFQSNLSELGFDEYQEYFSCLQCSIRNFRFFWGKFFYCFLSFNKNKNCLKKTFGKLNFKILHRQFMSMDNVILQKKIIKFYLVSISKREIKINKT